MNKDELTNTIHASREKLHAALARISDERMSLVILHGEWSVKDLIGHLCFWEERVAALFADLHAGKSPEPFANIDQLNGQAVADFGKLSLEDVRKREEKAYRNVLAIIRQAGDGELFDPNHFAWTEGRSFSEIISDNTWGHYEEHLPELTAWQKRIA